MTGHGDQPQFGLVPAIGQLPGGYRRADHVEATLHDMGRNMGDPGALLQNPAITVQKPGVLEIVVFQPGKGARIVGRSLTRKTVMGDRGQRVFPV
jgi:hypothetical protein